MDFMNIILILGWSERCLAGCLVHAVPHSTPTEIKKVFLDPERSFIVEVDASDTARCSAKSKASG